MVLEEQLKSSLISLRKVSSSQSVAAKTPIPDRSIKLMHLPMSTKVLVITLYKVNYVTSLICSSLNWVPERINSILSSMWSEEQTATVLRCLVPEELLSNCMMISQFELNNAANSNSDERNHTQISILILFIQ